MNMKSEPQVKKFPTVDQVMNYRLLVEKFNGIAEYEEACHYYEQISAFENEYETFTQIYEKKGKKGVKDICGDVLVPACFDEIGFTYQDKFRKLAVPVIKDGKMALVAANGKGSLLTNFEYDAIEMLEFNFVLCKENKKGLASQQGVIFVPVEMDEIFMPFNDLVAFKKDAKYGFFMNGMLTDAIYDSGDINENEILVVTKDGETGYINEAGEFTTDPEEAYFSIFCL